MVTPNRVLIFQAILVAAGSLVAWLFWPDQLLGFIAGAAFSMINFFLLKTQLTQLLIKKSIAWSTLIVVFKYAIFIGLLYFVGVRMNIPVLPLFIGMVTLNVSIILTAVFGKTSSAL